MPLSSCEETRGEELEKIKRAFDEGTLCILLRGERGIGLRDLVDCYAAARFDPDDVFRYEQSEDMRMKRLSGQVDFELLYEQNPGIERPLLLILIGVAVDTLERCLPSHQWSQWQVIAINYEDPEIPETIKILPVNTTERFWASFRQEYKNALGGVNWEAFLRACGNNPFAAKFLVCNRDRYDKSFPKVITTLADDGNTTGKVKDAYDLMSEGETQTFTFVEATVLHALSVPGRMGKSAQELLTLMQKGQLGVTPSELQRSLKKLHQGTWLEYVYLPSKQTHGYRLHYLVYEAVHGLIDG